MERMSLEKRSHAKARRRGGMRGGWVAAERMSLEQGYHAEALRRGECGLGGSRAEAERHGGMRVG